MHFPSAWHKLVRRRIPEHAALVRTPRVTASSQNFSPDAPVKNDSIQNQPATSILNRYIFAFSCLSRNDRCSP